MPPEHLCFIKSGEPILGEMGILPTHWARLGALLQAQHCLLWCHTFIRGCALMVEELHSSMSAAGSTYSPSSSSSSGLSKKGKRKGQRVSKETKRGPRRVKRGRRRSKRVKKGPNHMEAIHLAGPTAEAELESPSRIVTISLCARQCMAPKEGTATREMPLLGWGVGGSVALSAGQGEGRARHTQIERQRRQVHGPISGC